MRDHAKNGRLVSKEKNIQGHHITSSQLCRHLGPQNV